MHTKIAKKAFSLIELMGMLVTISCILAAFTPILTKRIQADTYTAFGDTSLKSIEMDCASLFNSNCLMCENKTGLKRCIICELTCASGETLDTDKCVCN